MSEQKPGEHQPDGEQKPTGGHDDHPSNKPPGEREERRIVNSFNVWAILIFVILGVLILAFQTGNSGTHISLAYFKKLVEGKDLDNMPIKDIEGVLVPGSNIQSVALEELQARGTFKVPPPPEPTLNSNNNFDYPDANERIEKTFVVNIPPPNSPDRAKLLELLDKYDVYYSISNSPNYGLWISILFFGLMLGLMLLLFSNMRRSQNQMMGGGFLSGFSKSPAKRYELNDQPITFADVAGIDNVKADLEEIVDFLKEPAKFQKLGGRVPKGVLLIGPPGTGKTLLARAVAGEANVPFYSVNGSEFIQMFVGVGASRVRDLFNTAKANSPSIIFVDEIDAVGRQRGAGLGGGHDEREQTLNQILGEMDGFGGKDAVIVIAATNRPDVLDPALLRPGRFDRHVTVSRPTHKGRLAIFKVHVRNVPLSDDVDLDIMAAATAGMTGADIANLVNEAALWAARNNKNCVEMVDFYYAQDKVWMGARREEVLSDLEKERTAYHEAGHTLAAWFLKGALPVHKVTIIPRGQALGLTQMVVEEDRLNQSENEIRDYLVMVMSGRAAEKLIYNELTAGAEDDLKRATSLARRMVTNWGMSERLGPVSYKTAEHDPFLGREIHQSRTFSEHTMEVIDDEVAKILQDASTRALNFLRERQEQLVALTTALIKEEELDQKDIRAIIGPSVHDERINARNAAEAEKNNKEAEDQKTAASENGDGSKDSEIMDESAPSTNPPKST